MLLGRPYSARADSRIVKATASKRAERIHVDIMLTEAEVRSLLENTESDGLTVDIDCNCCGEGPEQQLMSVKMSVQYSTRT